MMRPESAELFFIIVFDQNLTRKAIYTETRILQFILISVKNEKSEQSNSYLII